MESKKELTNETFFNFDHYSGSGTRHFHGASSCRCPNSWRPRGPWSSPCESKWTHSPSSKRKAGFQCTVMGTALHRGHHTDLTNADGTSNKGESNPLPFT